MIRIELVTGEPVVVPGDDLEALAKKIFESDGPVGLTTAQDAEVVLNPMHVVRLSHGPSRSAVSPPA
jgi:hypothetical protein